MAAGFATSAGAAMYKWTDAQGNVHYTQEPPPEGNVKEMAPPPRVSAPSTTKGSSTNDEMDETKSAEGEKPLTPEQQEIYKRNCEAARGNLETYKTARRIQNADGGVVVMDDEIRAKKMQQAEEQIKKFCR